MKKIIFILFVSLFFIAGCNTTQVKPVMKMIQENLGGGSNQPVSNANESGGISKDIEDKSCACIPYQKRTVCRIQVHLNSLGYNVGTADGIAGNKTTSGIVRYQQTKKIIPANGKSSYELLSKLRKDNLKGESPLKTGAYAGLAGAAAAKLLKEDPATWALVCGASGAALQHLANSGREKYAMRYYEIKDENERTEHEIEQLEEQMRINEKKSKSCQLDIDRLIKKEKDDKQFVAKASKLREQLDEQAKLNKSAKRKAELKIAILKDQIKDVNEILAEKPNEKEFEMTLATLEKRKATLVEAVNKSNGIERDLLAKKTMLDEKIIENS